MNDFLQQLRANSEKRYNKKRRQYDNNNQSLVYDRRSNDTRRGAQRNSGNTDTMATVTLETMTAIRDLLEGFVESQERMIVAEERKAGALESVADALNRMAEDDGFSFSKRLIQLHDPEAAKLAKRQARIEADPNRKRVMEVITEMRGKNATYQEIAEQLDRENLPTFSGRGKWHAQTVHRLCQS